MGIAIPNDCVINSIKKVYLHKLRGIAVPLIGCGAGELSFNKDVRHLMEHYLDDRFIACSFKKSDFYK